MRNDHQDIKFKKWLDVLQQESWQLELIISGFAIYGLFMVYDPIKLGYLDAQLIENIYKAFLMQGLWISWYILTANLVFHVVLRGLWIGAIGLRYVSGEIEYDKLNYSSRFKNHLMRRVGSFDNYVARLEQYCSIIFAITFILVFYLLGVFFCLFLLTFTSIVIWGDMGLPEWLRYGIGIPVMIFIIIGSLLTFIDFITQGWIKKKRWSSRIYFPFYWVFKYLTFSFLYRPMVYNLLDTRFGRRLSMLMVPLYIGLFLLASTRFSTSNYLKEDLPSSTVIANEKNYLDLVGTQELFINKAAIGSRIVREPYLKVFLVHQSRIETALLHFTPDLKPEEDLRGLYSPFSSGIYDQKDAPEKRATYLAALQDLFSLRIDGQPQQAEFLFTKAGAEQLGYETLLPLKDKTDGKHLLEIYRKDQKKDSVFFREVIRIPFWYYSE